MCLHVARPSVADMNPISDLENAGVRTAIVTGASRGLGRALAHGLATAGTAVVIDARNEEALDATRRDLEGLGSKVIAIAGSITDSEHRRRLVHAADDLGGVDLLVNNAGVLGPSPLPALAAVNLGAYRELFEVGALAPLALVQEALPALRARRGAIVNVTSDASVEPYEGWGAYGSVKAALDQLSRVLGVEEPLVRVWAVDPGDLRTEMHQAAFPGEDISDRPLPESAVPALLRLIVDRPPSGRLRAADVPVADMPIEVSA
jgi:NAD(P)-dependent dehydrogenase (short-subunit alcohol dehydrogenase family)